MREDSLSAPSQPTTQQKQPLPPIQVCKNTKTTTTTSTTQGKGRITKQQQPLKLLKNILRYAGRNTKTTKSTVTDA